MKNKGNVSCLFVISIYTMLFGVMVGKDKFGNVYYQHKKKKSRWVVYNGLVETSKVPPLWHAWLHYITDDTPSDNTPKYEWIQEHKPNLTGTLSAYYPEGHIHGKWQTPKTQNKYAKWQPQ